MNIFTADWDNQKKFQKISGFTMTLTHKVIHSFFFNRNNFGAVRHEIV